MIREIENHVAKLLWLWIETQGKTTPAEIVERTGLKRTTVMHGLTNLRTAGQIVRVSSGLYCSASGTDGSVSGTIRSAPGTDCSATGTCSASGTVESSGTGTESSASGTPRSQRNNTKRNKIKERKEELKNEKKTTDRLFDFVDLESADYQDKRSEVGRDFKERNISPDLLDRLAAGKVLKMPGFEKSVLKHVRDEAFVQVQSGKIPHRWVHVAKHVEKCYQAAGWIWTPCRTSTQVWVQQQHKARQTLETKASTDSKIVKTRSDKAHGKEGIKPNALEKLGKKLFKSKTG